MRPLTCPHCGETKVRRVLHPGLLDALLSPVADAWRCRACRQKFHRMRWGGSAGPSAESLPGDEAPAKGRWQIQVRIVLRAVRTPTSPPASA